MKPYKNWSDHHHQNKIAAGNCKRGLPLLLPAGILVALLMNLTGLLLFLFTIPKEPKLFYGFSAMAANNAGSDNKNGAPKLDRPLGGLLHSGFDEGSCLSRYESVEYLKELKRQPSSSLISRLRSYEALHRRCGPHTEAYNKTVQLFASGKHHRFADDVVGGEECKYVVWVPFSGLGNRILTMTSAFLYAILTGRVLLVDPLNHTPDLFCEPFPGTSWVLPEDNPLTKDYFYRYSHNSSFSYGGMVKNNLINRLNVSERPPSYIHLSLTYVMDQYDELFFKDEDQIFLQKIPWLSITSDEYFLPSLFLMPIFQKDLDKMFPEKDAVFHLLGRYLFHPANPVWGLITRYHKAYLAGADEKIGIQVRVFEGGPFDHVLNQIVKCTTEEKILPPPLIKNQENPTPKPNKTTTKVVLITSLSSWYADVIRDMYLLYPTLSGEVIRVLQPSHEEYQKTWDEFHYIKSLAEMYLLGMSDRLVTSGWSTFGYVAQGLGGLRSWVLYKPENFTVPDPPCQPVISMEPCFHLPPLDHTMTVVPYVRPCEDRIRGLKLYPDNQTVLKNILNS
ncbi:PREDICTED: probable fucosyltransferase 8 [Ipomoea nil]|uniref:probable fucosyltransferase 8 n=1 Tax=Ipomoea nil TaxID=35883 RepID=UPI0009019480|nr:PREDICTED: probable fucosyltransferase 8 [Ipomoea nil]